MKKFELYICDVESTGLLKDNDIIELSLYRLSNDEQKTWCIKPIKTDNIQPDALRVNKHILDDLLHKTKIGKEKYIEANLVIVEIENWLAEDFQASEDRILVGHNVLGFDKDMLIELWKKCNSIETFPFNKRYAIDTMQTQIFLEAIGKSEGSEYYNLMGLVEKYAIKKERAHAADSDVRMTKDLFLRQAEMVGAAAKFYSR